MSDNNIHAMSDEQAAWIESILPNRDPRKTVLKLQAEVVELIEALLLGHGHEAITKEAGDCLVLLLDVMRLKGIDPVHAFNHAMGINRERTWRVDNGALSHNKVVQNG